LSYPTDMIYLCMCRDWLNATLFNWGIRDLLRKIHPVLICTILLYSLDYTQCRVTHWQEGALGGKSNKDFIVYFFQTWPWRLCFPGLITSAESVCQYWILLLRCFSRSPCLLIPTNCKTMVTWKISQKHPSPSSWQNCDGEHWKLTNQDLVSSELFKVTCKPLLIWITLLFDKLLHVTWLA